MRVAGAIMAGMLSLALAGCFEGPQGPPGPAGPTGPQGPSGNVNLRVILKGQDQCGANGCSIRCDGIEVIVSAVCVSRNNSPIQPTITQDVSGQHSSASCPATSGMRVICAK